MIDRTPLLPLILNQRILSIQDEYMKLLDLAVSDLSVAVTSVRLKREQIQLVALDAVVGFVFDSGNRLTEQHFLEERH